MKGDKRGRWLFIVLAVLLLAVFQAASIDNPIVIVSEKGDQSNGIKVYCPTGYVIASGGFLDAGSSNDDQDYNTPINKPLVNGWYCKEDQSTNGDGGISDSECYALCISEDLVETHIEKKTGNQEKGMTVKCGDDVMLGGGFGNEYRNNHDQDYAHPKDNGWFCQEDRSSLASRCYAICAEPLKNYQLTCQTVSVRGDQSEGVFVACPQNYFITGGGFNDGGNLDEDQDASYPTNNGWFCEDYLSTPDSECYARCCTFDFVCGDVEICDNGIDDDCDGFIDYDDSDCELPKECKKDSDCGASHYGINYCKGDSVYRDFITPVCADDLCSTKTTEELVKECEYKCKNGKCITSDDDDECDNECKTSGRNIGYRKLFTDCVPFWQCGGWSA
ncbi:MAG: hypothetical protein ABIB79_02250, partial [archaeon]